MKIRAVCRLLTLILSVALVAVSLSLPVRAEVVTNTSVPFSTTVYNSCTGEPVHLTGELHVLVHITEDGNGGFHFYSHFQPMGVSGQGLASGRNYQAVGETIRMSNDSSESQFEGSFVNNFKIVGQGPGGNFMVHTNTHFTVNANGDVTADIVNSSVECR